LACALGEISNTARALERLAIIQQCAHVDDEPEDAAALAYASECLAQRVGWIADMAAKSAAPGLECWDTKTPIEWAMPPLFTKHGRA
jgi:hypothetical protein